MLTMNAVNIKASSDIQSIRKEMYKLIQRLEQAYDDYHNYLTSLSEKDTGGAYDEESPDSYTAYQATYDEMCTVLEKITYFLQEYVNIKNLESYLNPDIIDHAELLYKHTKHFIDKNPGMFEKIIENQYE